jgi:hypothetical protein
MTIAALKALCSRIPWCEPPVLESVVELALEIARGGLRLCVRSVCTDPACEHQELARPRE